MSLYKDPTFAIEHLPEQVLAVKALAETGFDDILATLQIKKAMELKSANSDEARHAVQVRILLLDELRNYFKGLVNVDT